MPETRFDANELRATANVYALLGRLWLMEVDQQLFDELQSETLHSLLQFPPNVFEETSVDQLAADYCRLFVGPRGHFPPIQSVWAKGQLDSEITTSVRSFAEAISYTPSDTYPNVLTDHLGVELEIMGSIQDILATQIESKSDTSETLDFATTFFARHLDWADELIVAALNDCNDMAFYRRILEATRDFLALEAAAFTPQA